jgi:hypothetical protein
LEKGGEEGGVGEVLDVLEVVGELLQTGADHKKPEAQSSS